MFGKHYLVLAVAAGALAIGSQASADTAGVKAGVLTCHVESGWGFVFGSSRELHCTFSGNGRNERYAGHIAKFGVDIGYLQSGVIIWGVVAPTPDVAPGALAGDYAGADAGASVGVGADANVLFGGFNHSIALQPVSVEGDKGINLAAGVAAVTLHYVHGPK